MHQHGLGTHGTRHVRHTTLRMLPYRYTLSRAVPSCRQLLTQEHAKCGRGQTCSAEVCWIKPSGDTDLAACQYSYAVGSVGLVVVAATLLLILVRYGTVPVWHSLFMVLPNYQYYISSMIQLYIGQRSVVQVSPSRVFAAVPYRTAPIHQIHAAPLLKQSMHCRYRPGWVPVTVVTELVTIFRRILFCISMHGAL